MLSVSAERWRQVWTASLCLTTYLPAFISHLVALYGCVVCMGLWYVVYSVVIQMQHSPIVCAYSPRTQVYICRYLQCCASAT